MLNKFSAFPKKKLKPNSKQLNNNNEKSRRVEYSRRKIAADEMVIGRVDCRRNDNRRNDNRRNDYRRNDYRRNEYRRNDYRRNEYRRFNLIPEKNYKTF